MNTSSLNHLLARLVDATETLATAEIDHNTTCSITKNVAVIEMARSREIIVSIRAYLRDHRGEHGLTMRADLEQFRRVAWAMTGDDPASPVELLEVDRQIIALEHGIAAMGL